MNNVLPITQTNEQGSEIATVQGGFNREFMVQSNRGVFKAKQAFSCLVTPEAGDKVLVNQCQQQSYIIAIVERPNNNDATVAFAGNAKLEAPNGDIQLTSSGTINLTSAQQTQITTSELTLHSVNTKVTSENIAVTGDKLTSHWQQANFITKALNLVTESLTQRIKNSFKTVEGIEQKKSLNYLQSVDKTLSIRSRDSVITARKDVKIDGERIHMG